MSRPIAKRTVIGVAGLLGAALLAGPAGAWSAAGRYGGSASGGGGSWNATGARGGSASGDDGSWNATNRNGATASGNDDRYYGGTYANYHPPTAVNVYGSNCYNCGGWTAAGAAVGVARNNAVDAYDNGYADGSNNNDSNNNSGNDDDGDDDSDDSASADSGGAAAAAATGAIYATLPGGCSTASTNNTTYFICGSTWYQPFNGANGVYYRVVPAP